MVRDAEAHAEEDHKAKESAEVRNQAEQLAYLTEKNIKDLGDKVPSDLKLTLESSIQEVREALNSNDTARIKAATDKLQQDSYKLSEILYQQASQQPGAGPEEPAGTAQGPTETGGGDEGVIDAEFKAE
jgi:molecular chaperone DnaK